MTNGEVFQDPIVINESKYGHIKETYRNVISENTQKHNIPLELVPSDSYGQVTSWLPEHQQSQEKVYASNSLADIKSSTSPKRISTNSLLKKRPNNTSANINVDTEKGICMYDKTIAQEDDSLSSSSGTNQKSVTEKAG